MAQGLCPEGEVGYEIENSAGLLKGTEWRMPCLRRLLKIMKIRWRKMKRKLVALLYKPKSRGDRGLKGRARERDSHKEVSGIIIDSGVGKAVCMGTITCLQEQSKVDMWQT